MLPQEVELWYALPAIRRELCKRLIELGLKQREVARMLGLTEAAVSQYLKSKRAAKIKFNRTFKAKINEIAHVVFQNKLNSYTALLLLCAEFRKSGYLCALHKKLEKKHCKNELIKLCRG